MPRIGLWDDYPSTIHMEPTKACNARCPQCGRTMNNTLETMPNLNDKDEIDPDWIYDKLKTDKFFSKVKNIHINGNHGDIVMHSNPKKLIEKLIAAGIRVISISTNGSGLSTSFWKWASQIHKTNKKFNVTFAIDGLHDTHHLYRRNTRLDTVLKNLRTFANGGGWANVVVNVNGNNKHQVDDIKKLAVEHGAKNFWIRYNERFKTNFEICYDKDFNPEYELLSADQKSEIDTEKNRPISQAHWAILREKFGKQFPVEKSRHKIPYIKSNITCQISTKGSFTSFYLSADGRLWPCCWTEVDFTHKTLFDKKSDWIDRYYYEMEDPYFNSLYHYSSHDILKLDCFSKLSETWKSDQCMGFCSKFCGRDGESVVAKKDRKYEDI